MERLDKILANTGRWSRKEARELVRAGRVAVDGVTAQAADGKYDPAARFEVDGETVSGERLVYLMLHKPATTLGEGTSTAGLAMAAISAMVDAPARHSTRSAAAITRGMS